MGILQTQLSHPLRGSAPSPLSKLLESMTNVKEQVASFKCPEINSNMRIPLLDCQQFPNSQASLALPSTLATLLNGIQAQTLSPHPQKRSKPAAEMRIVIKPHTGQISFEEADRPS